MESGERLTSRFSRRSFLVVGLSASGSLLAACGGKGTTSTPTTASQSVSTGTSSVTSTATQATTSSSSPSSASSTQSTGSSSPVAAVRGGDLTIGYAQSQLTLDPPVPDSDSQSRLLNSVLDPLVWQMSYGTYEPGLATSWDISTDAKTYTFKLRDDVKFQDDTPFNAAAVKFTLDRVADPKLKALLIVLLGPYDSSDVINDSTVQVTFKTPFPLFLNSLSVTGLRPVSPTAVQKFGTEFGTNVVGTGPFKLKSYSPDKIEFERFDAYKWGPTSLGNSGSAYLDTVTYRIIPEDATRMTAYQRNEVQFIDFTPPQSVKSLQGDSANTVEFTNLPGIPQILQLNVTSPILSDKTVRQSLQYAIDHETLVNNVWFGYAKPAYGVLASSTPGYWKDVETLYPFSKDKAAAMLDQAGWKMGSGGIREKDGKPLQITYVTTASHADDQMSLLIRGMLKDVGVDLKLDGMTNQASLVLYQNGQYDVGRVGEVNGSPSVLAFPLSTDNITGGVQENRSRYSNPQVDQLLAQAQAEIDTSKRYAIYEQVQQIAMDDAVVIGQWEQVLINTRSAKLEHLIYDPLGRPFFQATFFSK